MQTLRCAKDDSHSTLAANNRFLGFARNDKPIYEITSDLFQ